MAKGRFLGKRLAMSEKIAKTDDRSGMIYCLSYPHADRDGRLPFDAKELAGTCFPRIMLDFRWTIPDVCAARDLLVSLGLWEWPGGPYVVIHDFPANQEGMRYDREAPSIWDTWTDSGPSPATSGPTPTNSGPGPHTLDSPDFTPGPRPAQVQVQGQVEVQGEVQARARGNSPPSKIPSPSQESDAFYDRAPLARAIGKALGRPKWAPNRTEETAIDRALPSFEEIPRERWQGVIEEKLARGKSDGAFRVVNALDLVVQEGAASPARREPATTYEIPTTTKPWEAIGLTEEEFRSVRPDYV